MRRSIHFLISSKVLRKHQMRKLFLILVYAYNRHFYWKTYVYVSINWFVLSARICNYYITIIITINCGAEYFTDVFLWFDYVVWFMLLWSIPLIYHLYGSIYFPLHGLILAIYLLKWQTYFISHTNKNTRLL